MLKSRTAIVTGSVSGIGLAVASALAEQGAQVLLHGLATLEEGEALVKSFHDRYGAECWFSNADLRSPTAFERMVAEQFERTPVIDILVNNAGLQHTEALEKFPTPWPAPTADTPCAPSPSSTSLKSSAEFLSTCACGIRIP